MFLLTKIRTIVMTNSWSFYRAAWNADAV